MFSSRAIYGVKANARDGAVASSFLRFFLLETSAGSVQAAKAGKKAYRSKNDVPGRTIAEHAPCLALISGWGLSGEGTELVAERPQAGIPDLQADFRHRHFAADQQLLRAVHSDASEEIVRRLAERGREQTMEVKGRKTRLARRMVQRNLLLIGSREKVP